MHIVVCQVSLFYIAIKMFKANANILRILENVRKAVMYHYRTNATNTNVS